VEGSKERKRKEKSINHRPYPVLGESNGEAVPFEDIFSVFRNNNSQTIEAFHERIYFI
jgi:hypothetical protein